MHDKRLIDAEMKQDGSIRVEQHTYPADQQGQALTHMMNLCMRCGVVLMGDMIDQGFSQNEPGQRFDMFEVTDRVRAIQAEVVNGINQVIEESIAALKKERKH